MKMLDVYIGISSINFKCKNGDTYPCVSKLFSESNDVLDESQYVNADHTLGYQGGILERGAYYAIAGWRSVSYQPQPIRVLKLFKLPDGMTIDKIKNEGDLTDEMYRLPSSVPNPNHITADHPKGEFYLEYVQGHPGSESWDWSHGCITWLNYGAAHDFDKLMSHIQDKEIIKFNLI